MLEPPKPAILPQAAPLASGIVQAQFFESHLFASGRSGPASRQPLRRSSVPGRHTNCALPPSGCAHSQPGSPAANCQQRSDLPKKYTPRFDNVRQGEASRGRLKFAPRLNRRRMNHAAQRRRQNAPRQRAPRRFASSSCRIQTPAQERLAAPTQTRRSRSPDRCACTLADGAR